jgi:hypothetical protein
MVDSLSDPYYAVPEAGHAFAPEQRWQSTAAQDFILPHIT